MKYGFWAAIAAIFVCVLGVIGCTPSPVSSPNGGNSLSGPVLIEENQVGKPIIVQTGQTLEIRLKGNATTGYEWVETSMDTFSESPCVLERSSSTYQPDQPDKDRVGSGGTYIKNFKAVGKGKARITMQYLRPWEGQTAETKKLTFDISVN